MKPIVYGCKTLVSRLGETGSKTAWELSSLFSWSGLTDGGGGGRGGGGRDSRRSRGRTVDVHWITRDAACKWTREQCEVERVLVILVVIVTFGFKADSDRVLCEHLVCATTRKKL